MTLGLVLAQGVITRDQPALVSVIGQLSVHETLVLYPDLNGQPDLANPLGPNAVLDFGDVQLDAFGNVAGGLPRIPLYVFNNAGSDITLTVEGSGDAQLMIEVLFGPREGEINPAPGNATGIGVGQIFTADLGMRFAEPPGTGDIGFIVTFSAESGSLPPPGQSPSGFGAPIGTSVIETTFQQSLPGPTAAGDFNEDGILDVVVTSGGEDIHIMLGNDDGQGNGDGSFTQNDIRYPGEVPGPVKVGDVDNDGHLDIAWSDSANGRLTVVLGSGDGTFGPANRYQVFAGMRTVGLGDLNGDGYLDLLGGNCCGSSVAYLLNSGDAAPGMFGLVQSLGEPHLAGNPARGQIEVVDLNGDGELDVLIGNQGPNISVMLANAGDDGFTRSQLVDNKGSSVNGLAVGDFNGDNIPDLVSNHLISGDNVFLGIGDGTFGPATTYPTDSCLPNPFALAVAAVDLDGDGNLDIATTNVNCDNISVLMGDGAGSFSPAANFPDPLDTSVINAPGALVADDFNGDGKIDLLTTAAHSRKVAVMFNNQNS